MLVDGLGLVVGGWVGLRCVWMGCAWVWVDGLGLAVGGWVCPWVWVDGLGLGLAGWVALGCERRGWASVRVVGLGLGLGLG